MLNKQLTTQVKLDPNNIGHVREKKNIVQMYQTGEYITVKKTLYHVVILHVTFVLIRFFYLLELLPKTDRSYGGESYLIFYRLCTVFNVVHSTIFRRIPKPFHHNWLKTVFPTKNDIFPQN